MELAIQTTLPVIKANTQELRQEVAQHLEKYQNLVVTEDTLKEARALCTELNKLKAGIADQRKQAIGELSAPIREAEDDIKALEKMIADTRQAIIDQVEEANKERISHCLGLLLDLRTQLWEKYEVDQEFRKAEIEDLAKVGSLTAKNNLTKAAQTEVESRVTMDRMLMDRTEKRILSLAGESQSYGLEIAIQLHHVQAFIMAEEEEWQDKLKTLLLAELEHQMKVKKQAEEQAQRQAQFDLENQREDCGSQVDDTPPWDDDAPEEEGKSTQEPEPDYIPPAGQVQEEEPDVDAQVPDAARERLHCTVTCMFETNVKPGVTNLMVEQELRRVMENAGITTLKNVVVNFRE